MNDKAYTHSPYPERIAVMTSVLERCDLGAVTRPVRNGPRNQNPPRHGLGVPYATSQDAPLG